MERNEVCVDDLTNNELGCLVRRIMADSRDSSCLFGGDGEADSHAGHEKGFSDDIPAVLTSRQGSRDMICCHKGQAGYLRRMAGKAIGLEQVERKAAEGDFSQVRGFMEYLSRLLVGLAAACGGSDWSIQVRNAFRGDMPMGTWSIRISRVQGVSSENSDYLQ